MAETQPAQAAAPAGPSDPEIVAIVLAANEADVNAGKQAQGKAQKADVKAFADRMVADHSSVNKQAQDLATKLGVTPQANGTSQGISNDAAKTLVKIGALSGDAFEKAYVANEVAYHTMVLGAIDEILIPSSKNADLKALLVAVRPAFAEHLEHAKHLQMQLTGTGG